MLSLIIIILGLALTISTVDTLVNAISSLFVIDGKATFNLNKKTNYLKLSKYFIICCAFVLTVFYSFYDKSINEKTAYISIIIGLIGGFLLFPFPDFSKSLLVGVLLPKEIFSPFVAQSLLFLSFIIATFLPAFIFKLKKF
jgi:Na+/proline symporter